MCRPERGGIPSDEQDLGAGVAAMFPCSEQCDVSTRLCSFSTTPPPPPVWVPLNLAPCLMRDDPAARQSKCLGGLRVGGLPALCARACRIRQASRSLLSCPSVAGRRAQTWTSQSVGRQCAKARRTSALSDCHLARSCFVQAFPVPFSCIS